MRRACGMMPRCGPQGKGAAGGWPPCPACPMVPAAPPVPPVRLVPLAPLVMTGAEWLCPASGRAPGPGRCPLAAVS
nr:hypothetical protein RVX_3047 [Nitratidesulfovibrio sp. HK-II]